MLKVYIKTTYLAINGGEWREVGYDDHVLSDKELRETIPYNFMSFESAYEWLMNNRLSGVIPFITSFRRKPCIYVKYADAFDRVCYKRFNTMAFKCEFKEWTDVTLEWIMRNLPADQCIQYLNDRGMTSCPIMK